MRGPLFAILGFATATLLVPVALATAAQEREAKPREAPQRPADTAGERKAVPRAEAPPPARADADQRRAQPRQAVPRREAPRRNEIPPRRIVGPRVYHFPPVDRRLGFYYHPYFGFYYGPYYGPFYPYSGPYVWPARYMSGAIRTRVQPVETEVYVDGYYSGIVDDFDGLFQRLYLPAGQYEIEFRLAGYAPFSQNVYVRPGDTLDVTHTMLRLPEGQAAAPPPALRAVPEISPDLEPPGSGAQPASPYGMLALRVAPADAHVTVDGEAWSAIAGLPEIVIHLPAGWHQLDVRKDGYQPFSTKLELSEGQTTRLSVALTP